MRVGVDRASADGFPLVALAAALWGTDALFPRGLALELPPTTLVVYEHLILTAIMLPVLLRVPWRRLGVGDVVALVLIGAGASALATGLFSAAFRFGDPNTPSGHPRARPRLWRGARQRRPEGYGLLSTRRVLSWEGRV